MTQLAGCGDSKPASQPALLAILSAFPAELAPNLEHASVDDTVVLASRTFRLGTLEGAQVILGMTGIGTVNASASTRAVLDHLPVTGVVVSGVANSSLRVADVTVAETWVGDDGRPYAADVPWLARAHALTEPGAVALERCSDDPPGSPEQPICVDGDPEVVVGGSGHTSDPFGGAAFPCFTRGGPVFGCDPETTSDATTGGPSRTKSRTALPACARSHSRATAGGRSRTDASDASTVTVQDMETAAIAAVSAERGLPFIAFRATSDSAPDAVSSLVEFFTYYDLAALNASAATRAFVRDLAAD